MRSTIQWDTKIVSDKPNEVIECQSVEGSSINHRGTVRFVREPHGHGTIVRVEMSYEPPAGSAGSAMAALLGEAPAAQLREDLRRFKQLMETGEIPITQGHPAGPRQRHPEIKSQFTRLLGESESDLLVREGWMAEKLWGHSPAGLFGYSHLVGGYAGGQAEYARVPFADVGPIKISQELTDEQVLFLSDILPTGYMAAEACDIKEGDTVAVWGCGLVGQFAMKSALLLGASRVIGIDRFPERLKMARRECGAVTLNYEEIDIYEALADLTGGRGPDPCIEAVGMEAHMTGIVGMYERVKQSMMLETGRPHALRQAIMACRNGGSGVGAGCLWRIRRQAATGLVDEPVDNDENRADACASIPATAPGADSKRRTGSQFRHHA